MINNSLFRAMEVLRLYQTTKERKSRHRMSKHPWSKALYRCHFCPLSFNTNAICSLVEIRLAFRCQRCEAKETPYNDGAPGMTSAVHDQGDKPEQKEKPGKDKTKRTTSTGETDQANMGDARTQAKVRVSHMIFIMTGPILGSGLSGHLRWPRSDICFSCCTDDFV